MLVKDCKADKRIEITLTIVPEGDFDIKLLKEMIELHGTSFRAYGEIYHSDQIVGHVIEDRTKATIYPKPPAW